jgi:hypothetical protein
MAAGTLSRSASPFKFKTGRIATAAQTTTVVGVGADMGRIVLMCIAFTLSACGLQTTSQQFTSDIPGLTMRVAPGIVRDGIEGCERDGGINATYRRHYKGLWQTTDTVAYDCTK